MSSGIPGWTPDVERSFKEVLFRFLEEIQCTKAALYLLGPDESFLLATQYGFGRRELLAVEHRTHDPIMVKVFDLGGEARAFNRESELGPLAEYLRKGGTSKLLLVPLVAGDTVIGFVDARDKGRKRPFEAVDVATAKNIGAALIELSRHSGFCSAGEPIRVGAVSTPPPPEKRAKPDRAAPSLFDDIALDEIHQAALESAGDHHVVTVALTLAAPDGTASLVFQREGSAEVDREALRRHQVEALSEAGLAAPIKASWQMEVRRVPGASDPVPAPIIASTVALGAADTGSLTVSVISGGGAATARRILERVLARVHDAHEKSVLRFTRRNLARRLLEPGERAFPELTAHSEAVSRLAWSLADALDLGRERAEDVAIAGLLHDVGFRELDYERLYTNPSPSPDERLRYHDHVTVGERMVRGTGLEEIASAIRHHHERWDGNGYPDRLARESIPLLSRLVHVAEVFDVLSSPARYRPTVSRERALEIISRTAGHQFDPQVVEALHKVVQ
jgi:putative nucleotidyltransferase with HDIG domain